jgi:cell division protein FtsQ
VIRTISIIAATLLLCYIALAAFFFKESRQENVCRDLVIVVKDSLEKHFITGAEIKSLLKNAQLNPVGRPMESVDTELIESELMKNQQIASVEVYKTPSGIIKLEVVQKLPVLRVISIGANYYVDNRGGTMPVSGRYVAHVPVATGHIEKELATTDLYEFALFLQKDEFWNNQIEQIHVQPSGEIVLIPRVGEHRIVLGYLDDFRGKLDKLQLFYEQAIPKMGWNKYSIINLKFRNQIVCTNKK